MKTLADRIRAMSALWVDGPHEDVRDQVADALAAAPGLVPHGDMPQWFHEVIVEGETTPEDIWKRLASCRATPAPLAAQSHKGAHEYVDSAGWRCRHCGKTSPLLLHYDDCPAMPKEWKVTAQSQDQAIMRAAEAWRIVHNLPDYQYDQMATQHQRGLPVTNYWLCDGELARAVDAAKRAAQSPPCVECLAVEYHRLGCSQSPPPRGERIERSGKDRRVRNNDGLPGVRFRDRTGKDRRAIRDHLCGDGKGWRVVEHRPARNLRIARDGDK